MKNKLFVVKTDRGMGIRSGPDEDSIWKQMAREVGTQNVEEIYEATQKDIDWVRGMGGHIPKV